LGEFTSSLLKSRVGAWRRHFRAGIDAEPQRCTTLLDIGYASRIDKDECLEDLEWLKAEKRSEVEDGRVVECLECI
jgi:hypothetical protein